MNIAIGSDHGGYPLKVKLIEFLKSEGHEVFDAGTDSEEKRVDFPDYVKPVTDKVKEEGMMGILICGTGIGMCIAANKIKGIRAGLCHNGYEAQYARRDDDINVLCLGGRTTGEELAKQMTKIFIETPFAEGHYATRVEKIRRLENNETW